MEAYEVIDLSAHGPRRGLLVAADCIHPAIQPTDVVNVDHLSPTLWRVYHALTEHWLPTPQVAARAHYERTTTQKALGRLWQLHLVDRREGLRLAFAQKPGQEWRRAR